MTSCKAAGSLNLWWAHSLSLWSMSL